MITNLIFLVQIILSLLLTFLIFLQTGQSNESNNNILSTAAFQKRGWEKTIFFVTIFVLGLFIFSSIIQTLI